MRSLEKRIEALEKRFNSIKQEKPVETIGIALGCSPEAFIGWFDYCLHPSSKWHELDFQEKYEAVSQFCYKPGFTLPENIKGLEVELLDCIIETIRSEKRVRKIVGDNYGQPFYDEAYYLAWQEEEKTLRDRLEMLSHYRK